MSRTFGIDRRSFLSRSICLIVLAPAAALPLGCGPKATAPTGGNAAPASPGGKAPGDEVAEGEARAALQTALDSWAFGDTRQKFEREHPDVQFGDFNRYKALARYEIGTARRTAGGGHEFLVTLTFQAEAGSDVVRSGRYEVWRNKEGKWVITGGAR